jgi:RND family efflux transporter MFP subunit
MPFSKKAAALALSFIAALSAATLAQNNAPAARPARPAADETLILDDASLDWIEKSDVAALREGVVDKMELTIGMPVKRGKPIGYLHDEMAKLTVAKADIAARTIGEQMKAKAQLQLALAVIATNERLNSRIKGAVSPEEMKKSEAEAKVAEAMELEAVEKQMVNKADLDLAKRTLEEHTIAAPFDGIIIERMKHPGESVRANEPVVRLGNLNKLRAYAYVPLEYAYRVKEGQIVEFQPRLQGSRGEKLPIETKRFRGKISYVSPEIQPVAETAVRIYAEFENPNFELRPGLKGVLTIYLNQQEAPAPAIPAVEARTEPAGVGR